MKVQKPSLGAVPSEELFVRYGRNAGSAPGPDEIHILHGERWYRLRKTRTGKLILT